MAAVALASFSAAELVTLGLLAALVVIVALMGWRTLMAARLAPEELERRRRQWLVAAGKMGDASLIEARGDVLFYSYDVRGIEYTASQDISALRYLLPPNLGVLAGDVAVRYDARNPANSIILAEEWSGIRRTPVKD